MINDTFTVPTGTILSHTPVSMGSSKSIFSSLTPSIFSSLTPVSWPALHFKERIVGELVDKGYWVKATGSRVTKDGWTEESDWDYVVFDPEIRLHSELLSKSWVDGTSGREDGSFASLRFNEVNLILVKEEEQWKKWIIATNMIKMLNSKTKEERIKVFDGVLGKDKNMEAVSF